MSFDKLHRAFGLVQPAPMAPQKRVTSRPLPHNHAKVPVKLLTGPYAMPTVYTKAGKVAKNQPKPIEPGATVYASRRHNGLINLYPFELAGAGYELVTDAEEGVHFEFV